MGAERTERLGHFIALVEREPRLAISLLKLLCERVRRTSEQVEDSTFLDLPGRLAKCLLAIAAQDGESASDGLWVRLYRSQNELAQMLGVSRVSVNKHLQHWQNNGWIRLGRGHVIIRDQAALQRLVDASLAA